MNWLFENPLSELQGPIFLPLYAGVIGLILVEARWRVGRADRSREFAPEPIPTKPDPIEIAYLRGGPNEVTRLLIFDLIRRGFLEIVATPQRFTKSVETTVQQATGHPEVSRLSPDEALAFEYFNRPKKPAEFFQATGLAKQLADGFEPMAAELRVEGLISSREQVDAAWKAWLTGALMILAFGGFKLSVALAKGRTNVLFLLVLAAVGLVALAIACKVPRLTRRGKVYLTDLRIAFAGLKPRVAEPADPASLDPALILVPAVFGVAALTGTPYAYAPNLFRSATDSSGGCGGAIGSCGGGGCGCGGGGCGGCGGCGD